jgi:hypothetical protein
VSPEERRAEYIKGLRMFADLLEQNPDTIPMPYACGEGRDENGRVSLWFHASAGDPRERMAAAARVFPGKLNKEIRHGEYFVLEGSLAGFHLAFTATRNDVCQRIVTGEREVTLKVPDPTVKVPLVEVTETVEDVVWKCPPSLLSKSGVS